MHIQGLKSFTHVQVEYFLLMNIKQSFQKITQKTYIDINDLEIFKDFCKENKTKFKKKPKTEIETIITETIKMITARKR